MHSESCGGREVLGDHWSERKLTSSKRNYSGLFVSIHLSGEFESVESWVVADGSTIDLELGEVVAVDNFMWIEESWSSRRGSSSVTDCCVVDTWVLLGHVLTEESWFLRIVFIRDNHQLICEHFREMSFSEVTFHNVVETLS